MLANLTPDDIARLSPAQRSYIAAMLAEDFPYPPPAEAASGESGGLSR
ncbi:MAG: hypothetical protein R3C10_09585 [Pirellulales bacterium]